MSAPTQQPTQQPTQRAEVVVPPLRLVRVGFGDDRVDYERAWQQQRDLHAAVVAGTEPDTVLLLEHPAVYTAGSQTEPHERPFDGTPVVDVDRGGKVTWHGPGRARRRAPTPRCGPRPAQWPARAPRTPP